MPISFADNPTAALQVAGGLAYKNYRDKKKTRRKHKQFTLPERYPTGWGTILQGLEGGGLQDTLLRLAEQEILPEGAFAPFFAAMQTLGAPYQYLQDFQNLDKSMEAYGAGADRISRAAAQSGAAGRSAITRAGLSGSGAGRALAARAAQQGGAATSNLFSDMYQRSIENQNRYALDAFENERMITQMALGSVPYPRTPTASRGGLGASIGQSIGLLGGLLANNTGGGTGPSNPLTSVSPFPPLQGQF